MKELEAEATAELPRRGDDAGPPGTIRRQRQRWMSVDINVVSGLMAAAGTLSFNCGFPISSYWAEGQHQRPFRIRQT